MQKYDRIFHALELSRMQSKKLAQIKQQIAKLEREADKVRKAGIKGVVKQIKDLMEEHGIALADLGTARGRPGRPAKAAKPGRKPGRPAKAAKPGRKPGRPAKAATAAAKPAKATAKTKKASTTKTKAKYRSADNAKLVWSGRGRPPTWAKSWVDAGKKLDDLLIK
jgi:DNA-binding protein H-NS